MNGRHWRQMHGAGTEHDPFSELCDKVLLLISHDSLALSHFRPLLATVSDLAREVVIVTCSSGRVSEIEALGARVIDFDYRRSSNNPLHAATSAWELARIFEAEAPDVVHMVSMKPVLLGGLALKLVPARHTVLHMTGLAAIASGTSTASRLYRAGALRLIRSMVRQPSAYLMVDNSDDLALLREHGADPGPRFAILGGAGIDPQAWSVLPPPENSVPIAAFVGRMIRPKGVDVLLRAFGSLRERKVPLELELYGEPGQEDSEALPGEVLREWCSTHAARWCGHIADVREVWRRSDIFVLPARSREGMPRALLEAAASARPLIVTDVAGNRQFVRDGIEGLLVPPEDADALATALQRLAEDRELRQRMGEAARLRLLQGFTETQVKQALQHTYLALLAREGRA